MSDRLVGPDGRDTAPRDGAALPRPPFWPAPLLLLGLIGAVVGAACSPNQLQGPAGAVVAAPTALTAEQPTAPPTVGAAQVAATAAAPTATAEAAPTLAATPLVAQSPTTAAVPATGLTPTELATAASATTATPTPDGPIVRRPGGPELERLPPPLREIADGYLRYWDVRAWAYYTADASRLKDVMSGAERAREEKSVRELQAEGRVARLDIDLSFVVVEASPYRAVVYDEYVDRSPGRDAAPEPANVRKVSFRMRKIGGVWKVVDGERHVDADASASPTPTPAPSPPPAPTLTAAPAPPTGPTPPAARTPTTGATPAASPRGAATAGASLPTAVATARPTPTPRPLLEQDLERICGGYWPALTEAREDLDTSRLKEVAADAALARTEREVRDLRAAGQAVDVRIRGRVHVVKATSDDAVCYAYYVDRSVRVDAATREELPAQEPPRLAKVALYLKRVVGLWKVVDTADVAAPPAAGSRAQEIAEAYERYWRVLSEAYPKMEPTPLGQAMAGRELVWEQGYVAKRRAEGRGVRLDAEHNVVVVRATPDEGIVFDEYLDRSRWIELATGKETPRTSPSIERLWVIFRMEDGVWKAVDADGYTAGAEDE